MALDLLKLPLTSGPSTRACGALVSALLGLLLGPKGPFLGLGRAPVGACKAPTGTCKIPRISPKRA